VDFAAESARITRDLERALQDLERLEKKLQNQGFLTKASPDVIAKDARGLPSSPQL